MNKSLWIQGAVVAGAALLPVAGFAGPLGTVSGNASAALQYRQPTQKSSCTYSGGTSNGCAYQNSTGFLPYDSSDGKNWTALSASLDVSIASSVDANGLHAQAALTVNNEPLDPSAILHYWGSNISSATAVATWNDTLTIGGPAAANMKFGFSLDGSLSAFASARADAKVDWFASSSSGTSASGSWTFSTLAALGPDLSSSAQLLSTLVVQPGDVVTVQLRLMAQVLAGCQALQGPMLCTASSTSDVSHTLKFESISFQDGTGHDLSGYSITSGNFDYSGLIAGGAAAVPEPQTALLFALGLMGVFGTVRRGHVRR